MPENAKQERPTEPREPAIVTKAKAQLAWVPPIEAFVRREPAERPVYQIYAEFD